MSRIYSEHLHTNDKPIVEEFLLGEKLYYRCKDGQCKKPYDKYHYDISHNRIFLKFRFIFETDVFTILTVQ
jgi:hypothetical protein